MESQALLHILLRILLSKALYALLHCIPRVSQRRIHPLFRWIGRKEFIQGLSRMRATFTYIHIFLHNSREKVYENTRSYLVAVFSIHKIES
jgi:hypothetical protein